MADGELAQACDELRRALAQHDAAAAAHAERIAESARYMARVSDAHPDLELADAVLDTAKLVKGTLEGHPAHDAERDARHSIHRAQRWFGT